ncbi:MAG TPA: serine hydrolase domain-containing protein [Candidatus Acidoferrales bacterium]|nr:serine hydrolase domain-containing protein [Candidatus Acidoferrales bacterium]
MLRKSLFRSLAPLFAVFVLNAVVAHGQDLSSDVRGQIDKVAVDVLAKTGVPSASVAVVKDGRIAYLHAYGNARLNPDVAATPQMRYSIGSISKQFTAAAILLLQEQGRLSVDDKVSKYFPNLTRANEITIRQLLSHTSGYQDYWPQDYVMPNMLKPVTAEQILDTWAKKPLDFDPGTKWQYSNTNYVIAGLIVEKASGVPFMQFVREKILGPLGMNSATDTDAAKLPLTDPEGYIRFALGPARPAPKEGKGWMFAAGELAMTAEDLAKWDISIIRRSLLKPASYTQLETEVLLKNGLGTQYGLGVDVNSQFGHRAISHGGEVSGFTAENVVFPDEGVAIAVLTNQDAASAGSGIARGIAPLLFSVSDAETEAKLEQARKIFEGLQHGTIDRSLFTDNCNFYFNEQALKDFADSLGPLGTPQSFVQTRQALRGGMKLRVYAIRFANKTLRAWTYEMPDGKLEQYLVAAQE